MLLHLANGVLNPGNFVAGSRLTGLAQYRIDLGSGELPVNFIGGFNARIDAVGLG